MWFNIFITMLMIKRTLAFILLMASLLLGACQQDLLKPQIQTQERSRFQPIATRAWIEINQPLIVYAGHARAYLQGGRIIQPSELNLYAVDCEVEITTVSEQNQQVPAGRYAISKTDILASPIVWLPGQKQYLAWFGFDRDGMDIKRFYKFYLQSSQAPQVLHLFCRGIQDSRSQAELPTLRQMRAAVGDYISLHLLEK